MNIGVSAVRNWSFSLFGPVSDPAVLEYMAVLLLAEQLATGGPWGQHFPEPLFDGQFSVLSHRVVGEKHLKLTLDANGTEIEGIAFNIDVSEWLAAPLDTFHALYRLDVNEYRGERRAQLVIQSFWPC